MGFEFCFGYGLKFYGCLSFFIICLAGCIALMICGCRCVGDCVMMFARYCAASMEELMPLAPCARERYRFGW